jgi:pyruvate/2-oxoacid:ferredoxin oxidoreductase beta subunit
MKLIMKSVGARMLAVLSAGALAILGSIVVSSPAQAHSLTETVNNGCGSSYTYVTGTLVAVRSTTSSTIYGYTGLATSGGSRYCAFAYKSASHSGHGVQTPMSVCYVTRGDADCDSGDFAHWGAAHFSLSRGASVGYASSISHPTPGYRGSGSARRTGR